MERIVCARCGRSTTEPVSEGMSLICRECGDGAIRELPRPVPNPRGTAGSALRIVGIIGLAVAILGSLADRHPQDMLAIVSLGLFALGTGLNTLHAALQTAAADRTSSG